MFRHAQSRLLRCRSCSSQRSAGLFSPGHSSSAIGHAHPYEALAQLPLFGAACDLVPAVLAQPALAVDAATRRTRSRRFYALQSATMSSRSTRRRGWSATRWADPHQPWSQV